MVEAIERQAAKAPRINSVEYWAAKSGVGSRTLWRFVSTGELRGVKVGARTIITPEAWDEFMASRPLAGSAVRHDATEGKVGASLNDHSVL